LKAGEINEAEKSKSEENNKMDSTKKNNKVVEEDNGPAEAVNENNFYSNLRSMINQVAVEENEKFEDKIYYGFVYPMIDFFDNYKFNMERLKSLDSLCEQKKYHFNFKNFKQLGKEDKKSLLDQISESKAKIQEEKIQKIKLLKAEGDNSNYIKISHSNTNEKNLLSSALFNEWDIAVAKECLENNWDFPPFVYYERISSIFKNQDNKDKYDIIPKNTYEKDTLTEVNKQNQIKPELKNSFQMRDSVIKSEENTPRRNTSFSDQDKDSGTIMSSIYEDLIENNYEKYLNKKDVIQRTERGHWIDTNQYFNLFDNFVILYNPSFYQYKISIDNLWRNYVNDIYTPDDSKMVFYINTDLKFNKNQIKDNLKDSYKEGETQMHKENFDNINYSLESNNIFDPQNLFSILICFMSNYNKTKAFKKKNEENQISISDELIIESYVFFDLLIRNSSGSFELFEENICLNCFYDVRQINYIEPNKEYILICKGGLFPAGYTLEVYSDCFMDAFSYESYLEKFEMFKCFKNEVKHDCIEAKKYFILCKFSLKVNNILLLIFFVQF